MSGGYVQVAQDSTGKRIDNSTLTLPAGTVVIGADGTPITLDVATTVYRQRVVIGDPSDPTLLAGVELNRASVGDYGLVVLPRGAEINTTHELLYQILLELQMMNERVIAGG